MPNPRATATTQVLAALATALTLLPVLAADARAQLLLAVDGVELHGTVRRIMPGAGTCNVLETDTSYEAKKANHGAPMDVWRLDFSVRNGSGRWLDHLIARYEVESKWPDCTNWSGPDDARFRELNSDVPVHELTVRWPGTIEQYQQQGELHASPSPRANACEPYRELIAETVDRGLSDVAFLSLQPRRSSKATIKERLIGYIHVHATLILIKVSLWIGGVNS